MKIALVHEYLNQLGGAERVLENFLEIWPDAEVHVIFYDETKTYGRFAGYKKKISWLNNMPGAKSHPRLFLPLMAGAIEGFDFSEYDLVLSDSSSFAKGIKTDKLHICYCHTPTRYIWTAPDYLSNQQYSIILKVFGQLYLHWLKKWDFAAAQRPNFIIANSKNIQNQIQKFYKRESVVIPPPADTEFFKPIGDKQDYFFTAGRIEPYKRIDLVVQAFNVLGWPLKIAGTGTALAQLKNKAKSNIEFLGQVSDEDLRKHYSEAKAFIFPAEEDAGIMPVEAMSCGAPVIAFGKGGVLETVQAGVTGEFFDRQDVDSLVEVLKKFDLAKYDGQKIREHALQFDKKNFQEKIKNFVMSKYENRT